MSRRLNRIGKHPVIAGVAITLSAIACSSEPSSRDATPVRTASQALATSSCQALDIAATKASGSKPTTEGQGGSSYAIDTSGEVWGWGANRGPHFPLGHASTDTDGHALGAQVLSPVKLGVSGATKLAAGRDGACALLSNGTVSCWGRQLGGPDVPVAGSHTYLPALVSDGVNNLTGVTAIAYGDNHACALKSDATVWCWGDDHLGQLGDGVAVGDGNVGDATITAVPMLSSTGDVMTGVTRVAAAGRATCVLRTVAGIGEVDCMGDNSAGQLGQGTAGNSPPVAEPIATPITIPAGSNLSFGELYGGGGGANGTGGGGGTFCATTVLAASAQTTYCWGFNAQGEAAITNTNVTPGIFQVSTDVGARWAEGYLDGCEVNASGAMSCWGGNLKGQLPGAAAGSPVLAKTPIPSVSNAFKMALGESHLCALTGQQLLCWGENIDGQIGDGTTGTTAGVTSIPLSATALPLCTGTPGAVGSTCGTFSNASCGSVDCGACSTLNKCDPTSHTCVDDPTVCSPACSNGIDVGERCDNHVCKTICGTQSLADPGYGVSTTLTAGTTFTVAPDTYYGADGCVPYIVDVLNASAFPNRDVIGGVGPNGQFTIDQTSCPNTHITVTFYKDGLLTNTVGPIDGQWTGSACAWGGFTDGVHTRAPAVASGDQRVGVEIIQTFVSKGVPSARKDWPQITIIPR